MTFDRPPTQQCIQSQDFPRASVSDYVADLFTAEDHLEDALSLIGPTVTVFAFTPKIQQYGGGVFYHPEECVEYAFEDIPPECVVERAGRTSYTCAVNNGVNCKELLPEHCQLYTGSPQAHAVVVTGYGEVSSSLQKFFVAKFYIWVTFFFRTSLAGSGPSRTAGGPPGERGDT